MGGNLTANLVFEKTLSLIVTFRQGGRMDKVDEVDE
jgi:hypothetical protein